jgi:hypothetical protein
VKEISIILNCLLCDSFHCLVCWEDSSSPVPPPFPDRLCSLLTSSPWLTAHCPTCTVLSHKSLSPPTPIGGYKDWVGSALGPVFTPQVVAWSGVFYLNTAQNAMKPRLVRLRRDGSCGDDQEQDPSSGTAPPATLELDNHGGRRLRKAAVCSRERYRGEDDDQAQINYVLSLVNRVLWGVEDEGKVKELVECLKANRPALKDWNTSGCSDRFEAAAYDLG